MGKCVFKKLKYLCAVLTAAGVVLALVCFAKEPAAVSGNSNPERVAFLERNGWQVEETPVFVGTVRIPAELDEVYREYNQIQLGQGFDLRKYQGKEVERYQYMVLNYPNFSGEVRANLLVMDGKIIGGDICSLQLDGFMHGILKETGEKQQNMELKSTIDDFCTNFTEKANIFVSEQYSQIVF